MACPDCFRGGITTSHPTGTETTIHGLSTYVAEPEDGVTPKGLIVIITDAFGWVFPNNRVLADHYAKRGGFLVYCPDFMNGNSLDASVIGLIDKIMEPTSWFNTIVWKPYYVLQAMMVALPWRWYNGIPATQGRVFSFFQALRTSAPPFPTNNLKIASAGFCWGGKHTFLLAEDTPSSRVHRHESQINSKNLEPLIDCAFSAHPSYIEVPKDAEAVTIPTSVAIGDGDMAMKLPLVKQMKEILEKKKAGDHEVVIIPGAKHGFACRNHPTDKYEMECAEKAEDQAIAWFTRWFAG